MMWFACDYYEGEYEIFNTEEEARKWCKETIEEILSQGGWREESEMNSICYGEIKDFAKMKNKKTKEEWLKENPGEDWFSSEWDYVCDYVLEEK